MPVVINTSFADPDHRASGLIWLRHGRLIKRLVQAFFLIVTVVLIVRMRFPFSPIPDPDLYLRFSPLGPIWAILTGTVGMSVFAGGIAILLLSLFFGRFFCGWVCPLGTCIDMTDSFIGPYQQQGIKSSLRLTRYFLLIGGCVAALFSVNMLWYFDPLSLFTRLFTVILYPLFTLFVSSLFQILAFIPGISWLDWYWRKWIFIEGQSSHLQIVPLFLLIIGILLLERYARRGWCRFVCPAGALLGLLSRKLPFGRRVLETCTHCQRCARSCRMAAIPINEIEKTDPTQCIQCLDCAILCPVQDSAIRFGFRQRLHPPLDLGRRMILRGVVTGLAAAGLHRIESEKAFRDYPLIRPPGSIPEDEFLQRCIRCLACVRVCQSNGRCLQPADGASHLFERWTPIAVMRLGYCEQNCNLCGQVCPTGAILPLSLRQKEETPMGLAVFDRNVCIPHARAEDCLVCEEHCPIGEKAIRFDQREVRAPDGSTRVVKLPYVVKEKCIGCGICETKCPLNGKPGIFITPENARRPRSL